MLALVGAIEQEDGTLLALVVGVGNPEDRPRPEDRPYREPEGRPHREPVPSPEPADEQVSA